MAPKLPSSDEPPSSDDPKPDAAGDPVAAALGKKAVKPSEPDIEIDDDDDDEDLVVYTAQEAAGAFATIYAFVQPFLKNYRKMLAFVAFGVVVETLFNVIMPLSLKFLIDDALGEEDFQALYMILGVLAVAGIITSIVAIWYERWDAKLASFLIADVRSRLFGHVQDLPSGYFARTQRGTQVLQGIFRQGWPPVSGTPRAGFFAGAGRLLSNARTDVPRPSSWPRLGLRST